MIISAFGLLCWECGQGTLSYRCAIDENTGEPEMGNSKTPNNLHTNVSSVVEFQRWWVLKSKIFGQESTYSKEKNSKNSVDECQLTKNWA